MVEASQGCTGRPYLETTDPGVATGTPSTWDLEAGGSGVEASLSTRSGLGITSPSEANASHSLKERSLPFNFQATKRTPWPNHQMKNPGPPQACLGKQRGIGSHDGSNKCAMLCVL